MNKQVHPQQDVFANDDGSSNRKAEKLDLAKVSDFFHELGYEVNNIQQQWRHVHGSVEKQGRKHFFKLASTKGIGKRTQNEVSWNTQVTEQIEKKKIVSFTVPKIHETGWYGELFYYLSDLHEGEMLISPSLPTAAETAPRWIPTVVEMNLFLLNLENITFLRDNETAMLEDKWPSYWQMYENWYEETQETALQPVLEEVKQLERLLVSGINHGDFVPWHMILEKDRLVLIDGEHASSRTPRYYDIVYFYHRIYTKGKLPDLAKIYLQQISRTIERSKEDHFRETFRALLASRIIGGWWDHKVQHDGSEIAFHEALLQDFLNDTLS